MRAGCGKRILYLLFLMRLSTVNCTRALVVVAAFAHPVGAQTARPRGLPLKYAGPPTRPEITADDFVATGRVDRVESAPVVFFATGFDTASFAPIEAVRGRIAVLNLAGVPGGGDFMQFIYSLPDPGAFYQSQGL